MMQLEHLKFFFTVAKNGSFTKAAHEMLLTQPAVSSQISKLEEEIGHRLFERHGKEIRLTKAGDILLSHARKIFQQVNEACSVLEDLKNLEIGRINLGTIDVISIYVLPQIFSDFHFQYPKVVISIDVNDSSNISNGVADGIYDLGFVTMPVDNKSLVSVPIYDDRMTVIAHPAHPFAGRKDVTIEELSNSNLIIYKKGSVTRKLIEQVFESKGLKLLPEMEIDRPAAMIKLVEVGLGVSIAPEMQIKREIDEGLLVPVPIVDASFSRQLGLIFRKGQFFAPSVRAFLDTLRRALKPDNWIDESYFS